MSGASRAEPEPRARGDVPGDYPAASGTLTFGAGQMSRSSTVATVQDKAVEALAAALIRRCNVTG